VRHFKHPESCHEPHGSNNDRMLGLRDFYRTNYQADYMTRRQDVETAAVGTGNIYRRNVFPEMNGSDTIN
jgi:hypothetical protein